MDDNQLIKNIQNKDSKAFQTLVERHQTKVINICNGFVHNKDDAQDIAQEVFIEIYKSIDKFRSEAKLSTWIYRISVNKSLNFIRDNKKNKWLQSLDLLFVSDKNINNNSFIDEDKLEEEEKTKIIHQALNSLAENQKIAFTLNKYEDLSYKEISEIMKISISSVESLMFRAKKNLQKKLINYYQKK
ncbi:MAG: RNA polymerase sigma factor [Bacteroidales bacterium]|nr:RNA polymerase sigma factor [Bacteroidales bacterium]MBN2758811.1 RNA polymerase sigma factor [Bacteroidales bacterium]